MHFDIDDRRALRRCTTEVAGLGFDSTLLRFVKQHVQLLHAWPITDSVTFSIGEGSKPYAAYSLVGAKPWEI